MFSKVKYLFVVGFEGGNIGLGEDVGGHDELVHLGGEAVFQDTGAVLADVEVQGVE